MRRIATLVFAVSILALARPANAQELYPRETESYLINYRVLAKSQTTSYLLSAAPGFGAGHFYAGQVATGAIMLLGELVGITLAIVSPRVLDGTANTIVSISGYAIFAGFKIADMYLAPFSAETHNIGLAKRLKIKPLAVRDRGGEQERLAYGLALTADLDP